jgi:hypothetical protein
VSAAPHTSGPRLLRPVNLVGWRVQLRQAKCLYVSPGVSRNNQWRQGCRRQHARWVYQAQTRLIHLTPESHLGRPQVCALQELGGDRQQRLGRPGVEPVNGGAVDEGGELSAPVSMHKLDREGPAVCVSKQGQAAPRYAGSIALCRQRYRPSKPCKLTRKMKRCRVIAAALPLLQTLSGTRPQPGSLPARYAGCPERGR